MFVEMYHPLIPATEITPVRVAAQAVDEQAALGWLLVDPDAVLPEPVTPYYTKAASDSRYITEPAARAAFGPATYRPEDYGAKGDGRFLADITTTAGSAVITSASAGFPPADVGKVIWIRNGAGAGLDYQSTIVSRQSASQVTLSALVPAGISGAWTIYGTNDAAAMQAAEDACEATGGTVQLGRKMYIVASAPRTDRGGNAVIALGNHPQTRGGGPSVRWRGVSDMQRWMPEDQQWGSVIFCPLVGLTYSATYGPPSIIGGPTAEQVGTATSVMSFDLDDVALVAPQNPSIAGLDLDRVVCGAVDGLHVTVMQQQTFVPLATHPHAIGVRMPGAVNYERVRSGLLLVDGFYAAGSFGEHFIADQVSINRCVIGIVPTGDAHSASIDYLSISLTKYHIAGWSPATGLAAATSRHTFLVNLLDVEDYADGLWPLVEHIHDPNNMYRGRIGYTRVLGDRGSGGPRVGRLVTNGAANMVLRDMVAGGRYVPDASPTGRHGVPAGIHPPTLTAGKFGLGMTFAGDDSSDTGASVLDLGPIPVAGAFTLEGWFKRGALGGYQTIVSKWGAQQDYVVFLAPDGTVNVTMGNAGGNPAATSTATATDTTTWHHFAAVWDGTNLAIYLDGTRSPLTAAASKVTSDTTTATRLGGQSDGGSPFNGAIDEVRISSVARYTGTTLAVPTAPFDADGNTLGLWHMDSIAA